MGVISKLFLISWRCFFRSSSDGFQEQMFSDSEKAFSGVSSQASQIIDHFGKQNRGSGNPFPLSLVYVSSWLQWTACLCNSQTLS